MNRSLLKILGLAMPYALLSNTVNAQNVIDAGKYGQTASYGTARSIGFGGALGSVGGDFSSLSVNPAGIGVYRSSEFMITPGLRFTGSKSTYTGNESSDNNVRFGFNNLGAVFTQRAPDNSNSDWKAASFGIGLNRTADFSRTYNYGGTNFSSSASQYFENDALNYPSSTTNDVGTPAYLGYQSYLLNNNNLSLVPYAKGINQLKTVQEKGGITELAISGGGNYRDKLMIGATLGVNFLNHRVNTSMYEETINPNVSDSFNYFKYNESYKTTGTGVNLKLGVIYKFNPYFRAGIAFHTPTIYGLTEISNNNITVDSKLFAGVNSIVSPENQYQYSYISPFKTVASATAILGKYGFISADYELVSYNTMRYNMDDKATQNSLNRQLKSLYGSASNIRAGIELRFDQFMVRGGYGFYGSPYKDKSYQGTRQDISFGIGYRFGKTFVDLGIINSAFKTSEMPYVLDATYYNEPGFATIKNSYTTGVFTVGWKL